MTRRWRSAAIDVRSLIALKILLKVIHKDSQCPTPHGILTAFETEKQFEMDRRRSSAYRPKTGNQCVRGTVCRLPFYANHGAPCYLTFQYHRLKYLTRKRPVLTRFKAG
jgi:hypothetical protein